MKQQLQSIAFQRVVSLQSQAQRLILFFYKNEAMHVDRSKNICQFMPRSLYLHMRYHLMWLV